MIKRKTEEDRLFLGIAFRFCYGADNFSCIMLFPFGGVFKIFFFSLLQSLIKFLTVGFRLFGKQADKDHAACTADQAESAVPGVSQIPEEVSHQHKSCPHNGSDDGSLLGGFFPVDANDQYGEQRHDNGIGKHDQRKDQPRGPQSHTNAADADQGDHDPHSKQSVSVS